MVFRQDLSAPEHGTYRVETVSPFGKPFTIPEPLSLTIDTSAYPGFPAGE